MIGRSGGLIGGQGIPTDLHVQGGHGVHFRRTEYRVGLSEGSLVPASPCGWEPGISTHVSAAHDGDAAGAPKNGGVARPIHYALLSRGRLSDQVVGGYGGRRDHGDRGVEDGEHSEVLYRVDDGYRGPSVAEDSGPRLRARKRVTAVPDF